MPTACFAIFRVHDASGNKILEECMMRKEIILGRSEKTRNTESRLSDDLSLSQLQKLRSSELQTALDQTISIPSCFNGVSREHAKISWNDSILSYEVKMLGRNGGIVNGRKLNCGETNALFVDQLASISLGKSCFVYFYPSLSSQKCDESNRYQEDSLDSKLSLPFPSSKRRGFTWMAAISTALNSSGRDGMTVSDILDHLHRTHIDHLDSTSGWKRYVKSIIRKEPFVFDEKTATVRLNLQSSV